MRMTPMELMLTGGSQGQEPASNPAYRDHIPSWLWEEYQSLLRTRRNKNKKATTTTNNNKNKSINTMETPFQDCGVVQVDYNLDGKQIFQKSSPKIQFKFLVTEKMVIINVQGAFPINIDKSTVVTLSLDGVTLTLGVESKDSGNQPSNTTITFVSKEKGEQFVGTIRSNSAGGVPVPGPINEDADVPAVAVMQQNEPHYVIIGSSSGEESPGSGPDPASSGTTSSSERINADASPDLSSN